MEQQDTTKSHGARHQDSPSNEIDFDQSNPESFMMQTRRQAVTTAIKGLDEGMTIGLLLKMCHGLVTTNREIWERCKPFCCKTFKSVGGSTDMGVFYRVRHTNAKADTCRNYQEQRELILTSEPHAIKLAFEIPIYLPAGLECLVATRRPQEDDFVPNYGLLLQQSMLLIDELVPTFLLGFKAFLESHQLALGHVDAWLFHDNDEQIFLQDQFGLTMNYTDATWHRLFDGVPAHSLCLHTCSRCGDRISYHNVSIMEDWWTCKTDNRPGYFPIVRQDKAELFRCTFPGKVEFNVSIETPDERSRLIHFVKFMEHSKITPAEER